MTRAASPKSAWVKLTEQVWGGKTRVGHLSSNRFNRAGGSVGGTSRRQGSSGLVRGDPIEFVCSNRGLCCKRASFTIPLLPAVEPQI